MPRRTYRHRLQDLIDNPAISQRDKSFAQSLLSYYERKGSLTSGRVSWVKTLEERYSAEKLAANASKGQAMLERLNAVCERTEDASWARGFINSLQGQVMAGRKLSQAQLKTLVKVEGEHSDEAMSERLTWLEDYRDNKNNSRDTFMVAVEYYRKTGYFQSIIARFDDSPDFVPTIAQFNKMTKNKFALKAIKAHFDDPAYAVGSLVKLRSSAPRFRGVSSKAICVVIASNAAPVTSAARGAKVYKLLPMGSAQTFMAEERHIMKARVSKKATGK